MAVDPSAIGNLAQGFASLFLSGYDTRSYGDGRLGLEPVSTTAALLSAASAAKSLFSGGGGKQAARQAMKGQQTAAFPPGTSFEKYLDMTMPHPNLGVKTHREIYRARKDSNWMLSRGIGSEKDYGAYVALYMIENGHCDPNVKNPNSPKYKNCPVFASNGINIFDVQALENYYKKDALKAEEQQLAADVARLEAELANVEKAEAQQKENLKAEESEIREKLAKYDRQLEELALTRNEFQGVWQRYREREKAEVNKTREPCGFELQNGRAVAVYPNKQSSEACKTALARFERWVEDNKPLTMPEIVEKQREILDEKRPFQQALTDIQKQLKTTSPELAARKNEILQELNPFKNALASVRRDLDKPVPVLGSVAANLPGAYSLGPDHDAIGAPEPEPQPEPEKSVPGWLLPALGAGALLILTQGKR